MKNIIKIAVLAISATLIICSCQEGKKKEQQAENERLQVLCTFLPLWAFTKNIVGDVQGVEVGVLIPGHQGPHTYQLTPGDMNKISNADLFIANGYHLDEFLLDAVKTSDGKARIVKAAEVVPALVVGEEGDWQMGEEGHHEHGHDVNPHVFASPGHAAKMVQRIAEALIEADPENADIYRKNGEDYATRLEELAQQMRQIVEDAPVKKVVTFHNAFDYLAQDTGLEIVGVIQRSAGQQPSAGELSRLAQKVRDTGAKTVFYEPQFSNRAAVVLAEEAGVPAAELDPGATGELDPSSYENAMKNNIQTLRDVLIGEKNE